MEWYRHCAASVVDEGRVRVADQAGKGRGQLTPPLVLESVDMGPPQISQSGGVRQGAPA
jgi:hypothetical protein